MLFGEIIRNAGLNPKDYPHCSSIEISLYDGKDRIEKNKTVTYARPLFEEYPSSLKSFERFVSGMEQGNVTSMCVKIDEYVVVLLYKTQKPVVFLRKFIDPLDYMD